MVPVLIRFHKKLFQLFLPLPSTTHTPKDFCLHDGKTYAFPLVCMQILFSIYSSFLAKMEEFLSYQRANLLHIFWIPSLHAILKSLLHNLLLLSPAFWFLFLYWTSLTNIQILSSALMLQTCFLDLTSLYIYWPIFLLPFPDKIVPRIIFSWIPICFRYSTYRNL